VIIIGVREDLGIEPSHPKPQGKPISIKQAIGKDGFIQYRHSYSQGKVSLAKSSFDKPCLTVTKSGLGWKVFYDTKGNFTKKQYQTDDVMPTITKGNAYHLKIGETKESATLFKIDDLKILASFPSDFKMTGNFNDKWERIGNSVPPNLMKAIAEHIKTNILSK
jgi:DNA (cytosine-5)-methyltransferase 1